MLENACAQASGRLMVTCLSSAMAHATQTISPVLQPLQLLCRKLVRFELGGHNAGARWCVRRPQPKMPSNGPLMLAKQKLAHAGLCAGRGWVPGRSVHLATGQPGAPSVPGHSCAAIEVLLPVPEAVEAEPACGVEREVPSGGDGLGTREAGQLVLPVLAALHHPSDAQYLEQHRVKLVSSSSPRRLAWADQYSFASHLGYSKEGYNKVKESDLLSGSASITAACINVNVH